MKWVIELDEDFVKRFINAGNEDDNFCYYGYNSPVGRALKNAKSFEEEIKSIKEDIKEDMKDTFYDYKYNRYDVSMEGVLDVLDKHIENKWREYNYYE